MGFMQKANPSFYKDKDQHLDKSLGVRDFLALGIGTIISTSIFTLPGVVAANYAGPAVVLSFLGAAIVAGLVAFAYAEMSTVMPFAGSAYSWISVLFGEGFGWIAGWALLAEYFVAVAFVGSGFSGTFQAFLTSWHASLPKSLSLPSLVADAHNHITLGGGVVDLIALLVILLSAFIVWRGASDAGKVSQVLVILKLAAVLIFIFVGLSALHPANYTPFIAPHTAATVGGWKGITQGISVIFLAYIGFDSIAANSAEAKDPQKTMPRGILGSLAVAVVLFSAVTLVLVGMQHYTNFATGDALRSPIVWALGQAGYSTLSQVVSIIADAGMFIALLGMVLAGSRLLYSFGRDGMLPKAMGKLNSKGLPTNALIVLTIVTVLIGAFLPFSFLAQLISAGTLVAFMFVSLGMFALRRREGKDLPEPAYKMPLYPVLPALGFILSLYVFSNLGTDAKLYCGIWFVLGLIIYFAYGMHHGRAHQTVEADSE